MAVIDVRDIRVQTSPQALVPVMMTSKEVHGAVNGPTLYEYVDEMSARVIAVGAESSRIVEPWFYRIHSFIQYVYRT